MSLSCSPAPNPYGFLDHCVLHVDVDSFFCQVEELRCPSLSGRPVAVQQHQDIIAVNYPARQAGVKKHMPPAQARSLLTAAGGLVVHVFTEPDGRVSYRPYRCGHTWLWITCRRINRHGCGVLTQFGV
eukprot:GHRQ01011801.1.p2 GENE.GHRQ01011801.1~~GHRQ01011801.1.p2  ORF type:complete len:128 (+),score=39.89 GHRQ01011801.1:656-1039(+)